jgi:hypothetical protein
VLPALRVVGGMTNQVIHNQLMMVVNNPHLTEIGAQSSGLRIAV